VLAQADLALEQSSAGLPAKDELESIREVAIRGSEIVRQLMIYAGKESDTPDSVDVSQIAKEMIALLKVLVSKRATFEIDLGNDLQCVRASAAQIRQVVMNLVTNASEAIGDRDGVIRVATRPVTLGQADPTLNGLPPGQYVQLEVSDSGSGMAPEMKARIFDPFFTTKGAGHGLGLAVVQGIVRSLNGSIHVTSEPGMGTTFLIALPCSEDATENIAGPDSDVWKSADTSNFTVLVVEDESILRQAVARALRKAGFETLEASDGHEAINVLVTDVHIDLILLDLTFPGASSQEVITEAVRIRPELKVILTSGYSEETAIKTALNTPFVTRFIRKPFQLRELLQMVRTMLSS
jgi:CheY-like chemotaxis protein/two-component sensor histidine kinase